MSVNAISVFKDPDVANRLSTIHYTYVVVPADKTTNVLHPMFMFRDRRRK